MRIEVGYGLEGTLTDVASSRIIRMAELVAPIGYAPSETAKMIDIAQVQGQVHAQSVQKVGDLADKNPHETISIIRQWLHEAA